MPRTRDHGVLAAVDASVDRLDISGATLVDVRSRASGPRRWPDAVRGCAASGSPAGIGTLDLADAELDEVELRGIRIDYLALGGARAADLLVSGCTIGTLDVPQATPDARRVRRFEGGRGRHGGLRAEHLDLRGLDISYLELASLRGATLSARQVEQLAPALAAALGIGVED